jgi:hypothetical protein
MTEREIRELAAILVHQHGEAALGVAEARRAQHASSRDSDSFRVWSSIAEATARLLRHGASNRSRTAC